jgi:hypothetical protein
MKIIIFLLLFALFLLYLNHLINSFIHKDDPPRSGCEYGRHKWKLIHEDVVILDILHGVNGKNISVKSVGLKKKLIQEFGRLEYISYICNIIIKTEIYYGIRYYTK